MSSTKQLWSGARRDPLFVALFFICIFALLNFANIAEQKAKAPISAIGHVIPYDIRFEEGYFFQKAGSSESFTIQADWTGQIKDLEGGFREIICHGSGSADYGPDPVYEKMLPEIWAGSCFRPLIVGHTYLAVASWVGPDGETKTYSFEFVYTEAV